MMPRHFVFLRAINVGGHTTRMETLRQEFESLGFSEVETFIASGNVAFQSAENDTAALEQKIAAGLQAALGYAVAAFIRSGLELNQIAAYPAFPLAQVQAATAFNVAFLPGPLEEADVRKLMALKTGIDDFAYHGREVYWLCQKKQSESTFSNALLERTLGMKTTLRGLNTLRKMAEKYAA